VITNVFEFALCANEDIDEMENIPSALFTYPSKPNVIVVKWTGTVKKTDLQTFTGWTLLHIASTKDHKRCRQL
jgi:hypothetical protein